MCKDYGVCVFLINGLVEMCFPSHQAGSFQGYIQVTCSNWLPCDTTPVNKEYASWGVGLLGPMVVLC